MSYNSSTGVISGSVSHTDINNCLGTALKTNSGLCTAAAVESLGKWSKRKPVSRVANGPITDDNAKSSRLTDGYIWGLKCTTADYSKMYECTWAYTDKPTGGIGTSPYRLQDFNGFKKNAVPTLTGTSGEMTAGEVVYSNTYPLGCLLNWDNYDGNTYGVDPTTALDGWSRSSLYLCVCIDGYCTALLNGRANNAIVPIYSSSTLNYLGKEYTCPALPSALKTAKTGRRVSFFLTTDISGMNGAWLDRSTSQTSTRVVTVPNLAGFTVNFVASPSISTYGVFTFSGVAILGTSLNPRITVDTAPTVAHNYKIVVTFPAVGTVSTTFSMSAGQKTILASLTSPLVTSGTYSYVAYLYGTDGSADQLLASVSGSLTYTAS